MNDEPRDAIPALTGPQAVPPGATVVRSEDLFRDNKLVVIRHDDEYYRLTVTRNGKLILQK